MADSFDAEKLASELEKTYADGVGVNPGGFEEMPRRSEVIALTEKLLELLYPGFIRHFEEKTLAGKLSSVRRDLVELLHRVMRRGKGRCPDPACCREEKNSFCTRVADALLGALPELREIVKVDIAAAYAGDPAAKNYEEIIVSYPGLKAISIQRLAHRLYRENIPLIPRMMTEYAHTVTGIDINPGATLGKGVFIDHGTGVVIGETAVIGDNVRIYQGVTLGAGNFPKDACGMLIKGNKRHPTIGSNVTIYSGASVLGNITIGDNSVVGGNVWLTESLPEGAKITARPPEQNLKLASERGK
ncbi:MAG: serine O-acetyltransferase [Victivallaceae bacterium]|nr:serine O-acetyltransferase [Victivallaceae bacterium]